MYLKDIFKEIIKEGQEKEIPNIIPRNLEVPLNSNKIIVITGPRRSGKTYFLYSIVKKLLNNNILKEQILFINFDDPKIQPLNAKDMELILKSYYEMYPEMLNRTIYVFFDEIQNVKNWELGVRKIYDTGKTHMFITGSSSKLLSMEIATQLRGRAINFLLLPFSFKEILAAKNLKISNDFIYSKKKFLAMHILEDYLSSGGFPEIVLEANQEIRLKILKEYLDTMFFRDLVERYSIKNTFLLKDLIKYLITNISTIFSINGFYNWIKTIHPTIKRTIINYINYLEDINLFYFIKKFSFSMKEQSLRPRKCYLVDNGLREVHGFKFSEDKGRTLENIVFIELKKRYANNPLIEIFYWHNNNQEVDFIVKRGKKVIELIQVCANLDNYQTKDREIKSLINASKEINCNKLIVISFDRDKEEKIKGKKIQFISILKWLFYKT